MYVLGDPPNYTPPADSRLDKRAAKLGVTPLELAYDLLVSGDGRTILFHPGANYTDCSDANMALTVSTCDVSSCCKSAVDSASWSSSAPTRPR